MCQQFTVIGDLVCCEWRGVVLYRKYNDIAQLPVEALSVRAVVRSALSPAGYAACTTGRSH